MALHFDRSAPFPPWLNHTKALAFGRSAVVWVPFVLWVMLSIRLLITVYGITSFRWPALIFTVGCFTVGMILNQHALLAWLVVTPIISTFAFFGLSYSPEPLVLGFCSLAGGVFLHGKSLQPAGLPGHIVWMDGMATWIALGGFWHWHNLPGGATITRNAVNHAVFGFDDPLFLLTDTHLWLTAWILYRQSLSQRKLILGNCSNMSRLPPKWSACLSSPVDWVGIWIGVIGFACLTQWHYQFPNLFDAFVAFAPFEDIHAFGSVIGALFVGTLCCIRTNRSGWTTAVISAGALVLVASSYSRAAWLWVGIGTLMVIILKCPRRLCIALVIASLGLIGAVYSLAPKLKRLDNSYARRVADLVQINRWSQREDRLRFYQRSIDLVLDRPWFGYGTGSSRRLTGDFIHNFLLQIATESGVPAACFLVIGLACAVLRGLSAVRRQVASVETKALLTAALTYLGTQLTANAINIYSTQVFFFWPLLAMLYHSAQSDLNPEGWNVDRRSLG